MIGQEHLKETFKLHHFNLLVGPQGQGKKTFIKEYVIPKYNYNVVYLGTSIEDMRTLIESVYDIATPTLYVIADADNMNVRAKNSILKVAEEPPENIYMLMTLSDISLTLPTIISRANVYYMDNYTEDELKEYKNIDVSLCDNIMDVQLIEKYDMNLFHKYINNIVNKVPYLSYGSLFKAKELLNTFDIKFVFKSVINECIKANKLKMADITSRYLSKLRINTLNKELLINAWLLELKECV